MLQLFEFNHPYHTKINIIEVIFVYCILLINNTELITNIKGH